MSRSDITQEEVLPFNVKCGQGADSVGANVRDVSVKDFSVSVGGKTIFTDTNVKIIAGHRYGLMGPNGRGKTTLLRLIEARELPVPKNLHVLLVGQEKEIECLDTPAVQVVMDSDTKSKALMKEAEELRNAEEADIEKLNDIEDELEARQAHNAEGKARKILLGLGFPPAWQDRPTQSFSGGWRKRIALACAVFMEPDVLLLDEPTNHLDLEAVLWLEAYIPTVFKEHSKRPKALVVVSHDVSFLDQICTDMVHIDEYKLWYYRGAYKQFVQALAERRQQHDSLFVKQEKKIKEWKRNGVTKKQVEEKLALEAERKHLEQSKLEKRQEYSVTFPFQEPPLLREGFIVKVENMSFHYPPHPETGEEYPTLFENVDCSIWTDSRIALVGPNGVGKTTLLRLLTGELEPTDGMIEFNRQVRIGKYSQHFIEQLPTNVSAVEFVQKTRGDDNLTEARKLLGSFGLEGVNHHNKIEELSGGQKARVAFAGISVSKPHVLLFDEPTNHLDLESIDALTAAIKKFKGGVLLISHDARLIRDTVDTIWVVDNKGVETLESFEDYRELVLGKLGLDNDSEEEEEVLSKAERKARAMQKQQEKKGPKNEGGKKMTTRKPGAMTTGGADKGGKKKDDNKKGGDKNDDGGKKKGGKMDNFFAKKDNKKEAKKDTSKPGGKK